jgi:hypothetical protein
MRIAKAMQVFWKSVIEVKRQTEWVIAKGGRRIGAEIDAVKKATSAGPGRGKQNNLTERKIVLGRGALGIPGHLRSRYLRLNEDAAEAVLCSKSKNRPAQERGMTTRPAICKAALTERRFRSYWDRAPKCGGNERQ